MLPALKITCYLTALVIYMEFREDFKEFLALVIGIKGRLRCSVCMCMCVYGLIFDEASFHTHKNSHVNFTFLSLIEVVRIESVVKTVSRLKEKKKIQSEKGHIRNFLNVWSPHRMFSGKEWVESW